jgi:S1-C subfamily serine protease
VIALGSPLQLSDTVTFGIISSINRKLPNTMDYIQTDATITTGNSGGPLINLDGNVVGMNTMIAGFGIGFAIPSRVLKSFSNEIFSNMDKYSSKNIVGKRINFIGIKLFTIDELSADLLEKMGIKGVSSGCFVSSVVPNSPAHK